MSQRKSDLGISALDELEKVTAPLKGLEPGDVVAVTRLDRLVRSTIDLLTTIKQIADKSCFFKSVADPWADTSKKWFEFRPNSCNVWRMPLDP